MAMTEHKVFIDTNVLKEVLRLKYAAALTHRQIAGALNLSVGVVNKYLAAAERAALTYPLPAECDDAQLAQLLFGSSHQPASLKRQTLDFALVHQELKRKASEIVSRVVEIFLAHPR